MPALPAELTLVRHAQSAGNVARNRALAERAARIDIDARDCDVPLSELGRRQAAALGRWAAHNVAPPDLVCASPYVRAMETARLALDAAAWTNVPIAIDERLREKDLGALDRLTSAGIAEHFPAEVTARKRLGKFYYRPPGGESWTDVILRLRSFYGELVQRHSGARIVLVAHQVTVLCMRYVVEGLTEAEILEIDGAADLANCSVTRYVERDGALQLVSYNAVAPMEEAGEPVTRSPDVTVGTR